MQPITLSEVTKSYGPTTALADVSLSFEPGAVHGLLGPNGAGKTTLFRVLLGLTRPDSGTASVPDATVGCGFQDPQFYGGLTVAENLALFADLTDATDEWVDRLVDRCGLARVRHRSAGEISAGFAKRLDLAIALVDRPDVLLLDEPLADVDEEYRDRLTAFFEDYVADDRLIVLATHQLGRFEPVIESVTVLADGRVRWTGSPEGDVSGAYSDALDGEGR